MRFSISILFAMTLLATACNNSAEQKSTTMQSRHTAAFNRSMDSVLSAYYALTESFVNWDSTSAEAKATLLKNRLDSVALQEFKDSVQVYETAKSFIANISGELQTIATEKDITAKRRSFNSVTDNMYNLLRALQYDREPVYLQECPMAFNDQEPGIWLSRSDEIRNPYLGLHHPKYGKGMLSCGENKAAINFKEQIDKD